jgi:rare lipoprotein A
MSLVRFAAAAAATFILAAATVPAEAKSFSGTASWYQHGARTASGARFNPDGYTAAHRSLPFGTKLKVTNRRNGKTVQVTVNDRGPFTGGRVLDVSRGAARVLGMVGSGTAPVSVQLASN